ncbi:putative hemicentin-1-like [Penaeus vannamei]|uniref:Putative hemicentin-1-like n=1 Tax=Penaeus vannamei TaxID=6689 RepID=A0A423TLG9_PENVA|nr:putative hemicentin-1-like [Penaeus vannamei]
MPPSPPPYPSWPPSTSHLSPNYHSSLTLPSTIHSPPLPFTLTLSSPFPLSPFHLPFLTHLLPFTILPSLYHSTILPPLYHYHSSSLYHLPFPPSLYTFSSRQRDSGRGGAGGSQRPVASVVGPFQEGEMLVLTCLAHGGSPRPSVVWFRDTYLIDFNMESEETSPVIELASLNHTTVPPAPYVTTLNTGPSQTIAEPYNTLTLGPLTRNDLKLLLTCEASNNNLTIPTSVVVMVDMNYY